MLEGGGAKLPCARLAIRIRESGAAVDDLSSVTKPSYFATTFRQKFTFLRHFWTRRWRLELRSCPFRPSLVSICRSVTELAAETRVGSNGQESSSEWQSGDLGISVYGKKKVSKKMHFWSRLRLTAPLQNKKNQEISIILTSAELASGSAELRSGSAELGSAPAELQILGKFSKILLKSSRSSLRAGSETRRSSLGSSAELGPALPR